MRKGSHHSSEAKELLRNGVKAYWASVSDEQWQSHVTRLQKMGESHIGSKMAFSKEHREFLRNRMARMNKDKSIQARKTFSRLVWFKKHKQEWRKQQKRIGPKISAGLKRKWREDPEYSRRMALAWQKSPTSIESKVRKCLRSAGIDHRFQHPIGGWIVDFYIPSLNMVVECDGTYWHSKAKAQAKDRRRDRDLKARGYRVLRLSQSEIEISSPDDIVARLYKPSSGQKKWAKRGQAA